MSPTRSLPVRGLRGLVLVASVPLVLAGGAWAQDCEQIMARWRTGNYGLKASTGWPRRPDGEALALYEIDPMLAGLRRQVMERYAQYHAGRFVVDARGGMLLSDVLEQVRALEGLYKKKPTERLAEQIRGLRGALSRAPLELEAQVGPLRQRYDELQALCRKARSSLRELLQAQCGPVPADGFELTNWESIPPPPVLKIPPPIPGLDAPPAEAVASAPSAPGAPASWPGAETPASGARPESRASSSRRPRQERATRAADRDRDEFLALLATPEEGDETVPRPVSAPDPGRAPAATSADLSGSSAGTSSLEDLPTTDAWTLFSDLPPPTPVPATAEPSEARERLVVDPAAAPSFDETTLPAPEGAAADAAETGTPGPDGPGASAEEPDASAEEPDASTEAPDASTDAPDASAQEPEASADEAAEAGALPAGAEDAAEAAAAAALQEAGQDPAEEPPAEGVDGLDTASASGEDAAGEPEAAGLPPAADTADAAAAPEEAATVAAATEPVPDVAAGALPSGGKLLLLERFSGGLGPERIGGAWTIEADSLRGRGTTLGDSFYVLSREPWLNVHIGLDFQLEGGRHETGLLLRGQSETRDGQVVRDQGGPRDGYLLRVRGSQSPDLLFHESVDLTVLRDGRSERIVCGRNADLQQRRWYRLGVRLDFGRIDVELDGRPFLSCKDATYAAGTTMLRLGGTTQARFDDVEVRELPVLGSDLPEPRRGVQVELPGAGTSSWGRLGGSFTNVDGVLYAQAAADAPALTRRGLRELLEEAALDPDIGLRLQVDLRSVDARGGGGLLLEGKGERFFAVVLTPAEAGATGARVQFLRLGGREWETVAQKEVDADLSRWHRLALVRRGGSLEILLDGQSVLRGRVSLPELQGLGLYVDPGGRLLLNRLVLAGPG